QTWGQTAGEREVRALHVTLAAPSRWPMLAAFGEVMCDNPPVLPAATVPAHPGQRGAAHGVIDGLLGWRHNSVRQEYGNTRRAV
ncbi:hypothetical protein M9458_028223, partial [Cirrhinus mrigala]